MSFDPDAIYRELITQGEAWVKANGEADFLEETRKTLEAQLTLEHIEAGDSAAAAGIKAKADDRYELHVKGMCEAREKANGLKVRYDAAKELSQNRRTQESTRRAERQAEKALT